LKQKTIAVEIEETSVVDLDRHLYGMSDADYFRLISNLKMDPFLGSIGEDDDYEYFFAGLSVNYLCLVDQSGIFILIKGIRPVEAISKSMKVKQVTRQAIDALKEIKAFFGLFGVNN
jgi:hypothetical protein